MNVRISSRLGFRYNNLLVCNTSKEGIFLKEIKENVTTKTYFEINVPGKDGSNYISNKLCDKIIEITVIIFDRNKDNRHNKTLDVLNKVVNSSGRLIILDKYNKFYNAKVFAAPAVKEDNYITEINIKFTCSYCLYLLDNITKDIVKNIAVNINNISLLEEKYNYNSINKSSNVTIANDGYKIGPLIKITSKQNSTSINIKNKVSFTLNNLIKNDIVFVDCVNKIVYKEINNSKISMLNNFNGEFIDLLHGDNLINISGTNFNIDLEIKHKKIYLL